MDVPLTRRAVHYQYGVALIASMGAMTAGAWLSWASAAIVPLETGQTSFNISKAEASSMVALMDLGNVLTPVPTSFAMDLLGRKYTLYSTALMYIAASVCVLTANSVWYLYAARIFAGMAKGVAFAVVPILLAEVANVQVRGALSTMFIGFLNLGMFYDYLCGWLLSYDGLNIANVVIPVLFSVTFLFVPESPYYLVMKHQEDAALKSLSSYRQMSKDNVAVRREYEMVKATVDRDMSQRSRFWDVAATPANRRALLIISLLATFQRMSGISPTLAYMSVTLPKTGGGASIQVYLVIFSSILVIANYVATPLIDTLGRKRLLIYSALSSALVQVIAGVFYHLRDAGVDVDSCNWIPYACLIIYAFTYSLGIGFIPSTLVGELFPQNVKSYASSISAMLLALTSFIVNKIFRHVPTQYMYYLFSLACIACTLFTIFYVLETRGKAFMQIQDELLESTQRKGNNRGKNNTS